MNILLVAATAKEITPFLNHYQSSDINADIDILITGIGLTASAYAITKQVNIKRPALVIQAGIAGGFDRNIPLGTVVTIGQDAIADLSVTENKQLRTMFDIGLTKPGRFPFRGGWLVNPNKKLQKQVHAESVKGISVNHITTSKKMISAYQEKFEATIESMEGAAMHYVCLMEKIPFLQIRSISNYVGERQKKKWNFHGAVENLNISLTEFVGKR